MERCQRTVQEVEEANSIAYDVAEHVQNHPVLQGGVQCSSVKQPRRQHPGNLCRIYMRASSSQDAAASLPTNQMATKTRLKDHSESRKLQTFDV